MRRVSMTQKEPLHIQQGREWQELLDKARACWEVGDDLGAEEPWADLQARATPMLLGISRSKLPLKWSYKAEDLAAEALMDLWSKVSSGQEVRNVKPLLARIVLNKTVDLLRHEANVETESPDAFQDFWKRNAGADGQTDAVDKIERRHEINNVLDMLTPLERDILTYRFLLDLSIEETAGALSLTIDKVKKGQKRALEKARAKMQERGINYGDL